MKKGTQGFLFIHGFGGAGALWARQMDHFAPFGRVVASDLPGHGGTPWATEGLDEMSQKILADGINGRVAVVANSFGGLVALKLWEKAPHAFSSLTFVGFVPRFTACDGFPAGLTQERIRKLGDQLQGDVAVVLEMFVRSLFTRHERESLSYREVKRLRQGIPVPSREVLLKFLDILGTTDMRAVLKTVDIPVQFILGDGDHICPLSVIEPLKALCPSARVDVMKGCGHFPFLSRPDEFNQLLQDFVE